MSPAPPKPTFVIAEVGSNHCGSLALAKAHIEAARECGADAVKFQSLALAELYWQPEADIVDLHARIDLPEAWMPELADCARAAGIVLMSSPTYLRAVELLQAIEVPVFKLASAQVATFPQLIDAVARTGKPTLLSTGIAGYEELTRAIRLFEAAGNRRYTIMHCNSLYPVPAQCVQLGRMQVYREMFGCPVGFSDHSAGTHLALAATALGASAVEKHFRLHPRIDSPDAPISIDPAEFTQMVRAMREIEAACAATPRIDVEPEEAAFRERIRYRLVLARAVAAGECFGAGDFRYLRHARGIDAGEAPRVLATMQADRDLAAGTLLEWSQLRGRV